MSSSSSSLSIPSLFSVRDKVVVVTGGSRGIGRHIAAGFVENGARCVYITARKRAEVEATARELSASGPGRCVGIVADLARADECERVAREIDAAEAGGVDVLVNNAGAAWGEPFAEYSLDGWDKIMAINVRSVFVLTRALHAQLCRAAARSGDEQPATVINIGSIDGIRPPGINHYAYSASKAAVHQLTRALANEFADDNIAVNAIAAGPFATKMMKHSIETMGERTVAALTLQQRLGRASDIFGLCAFLSSRAGAHLTGAIVPCEGGALGLSYERSLARGAQMAKL